MAGARANRAFLRRAVTAMAAAGIEQFLDLGAGLPGPDNVHEVARSITPGARVVYVDHDPVVVRHAQALLACDDGVIAVQGDLRDPYAVVTDPQILRHLDMSGPVGVLLVDVLHFVTDPYCPSSIVTTIRDAVAAGSYLAVSHVADLAGESCPRTGGGGDAAHEPRRSPSWAGSVDSDPGQPHGPDRTTACLDLCADESAVIRDQIARLFCPRKVVARQSNSRTLW